VAPAAFLFLCYVFAYLDRVNVGFAKLQMMSDLGLSEAVYGMGAGVFFAGYLMFEVPSNIVMLKVGARKWITRIMVTWGADLGAMMFVNSPASFYAPALPAGRGRSRLLPRHPAVPHLLVPGRPPRQGDGAVHDRHPDVRRDRRSAVRPDHGHDGQGGRLPRLAMGVRAGGDSHHHPRLHGLVLPRRQSADAKWLGDSEKSLIEHELNQDKQGTHLHNLRDGLVNPRVWLLSAIYLFYTMGLYGISFWLPTIIKASGVSKAFDIGMLTMIPYAAATVTMILVGAAPTSAANGAGTWRWPAWPARSA
jgi:hypothetical protein